MDKIVKSYGIKVTPTYTVKIKGKEFNLSQEELQELAEEISEYTLG